MSRYIIKNDQLDQLISLGNKNIVVEEEEEEQEEILLVHNEDLNNERASASSSVTREDKYQWTDDETRLFLTLLEQFKTQLDNPKHKKKDIFVMIAKEMYQISEQKYNPSPFQCDNRYKSLLRKYKEVKDYNNTSGNDHKKWKYFDDMEAIMKNKSNITPVASCSSLELQNNEEKSITSLKEILAQKQNKRKENECISKSNKRKRPRSELVEFMKKCEENAEEREKRRLEQQKEQHEDFKNLMTKLLEKL